MTEEFTNFKNFQRSNVRHWFDFPSEHKNETLNFYASDNEETFDKNASMDWKVQGGETPTSHITQDRTFTKDQINYKFNSEGFRGPEIKPSDAEYKVLHYGGSFSFGSGLNEEEWRIMSRCNEFARMASPGDGDLAESLAVHWFNQWRENGISPRTIVGTFWNI